AESSSLLESLLLMVTGAPARGDPPCKVQPAMASRCCPTVTVGHAMAAGTTMAVTLGFGDGVLKRGGVAAVRAVLPVLFASGLNCTVAVPSPPLNAAGAT